MHVELHRHSMWSLLDGSGAGDLWAARAAELQMPVLALTDHGTLAGSLDHIAACQEHGIIPVSGCEVYYRDNRLVHDKSNAAKFHLTLLAMNFTGWLNLCRLTTESYQSGFYSKPCVDPELLSRYSEGIYCLGGCINGRLSQHILGGYEPDVKMFINVMRGIFKDNYSLEIMCHDFDDQRRLNIDTWRVGYEEGIPLTVTGDAHGPTVDWRHTTELLLMLATRQSNLKRKAKEDAGEDTYTMVQENPTLFLMTGEEKLAAFKAYHPQMDERVVQAALDHSGEIIKKFTPITIDKSIKMPKLTRKIMSQIDDDATYTGDEMYLLEQDMVLIKDTLRRWVYGGLEELQEIYPTDHWLKFPHSKYLAQIEHEFATFDAIGDHVWRYMVMAAGECRWARKNGIHFAPRGSAVASTVGYLSGISDLDPISYDLMFERFINVGRRGMPDIDIDFMPGALGRDRVKEHTSNIYGADNVIDIGAYQTYGPKAAIRAVCRIYDDEIDYLTADRYAKVLDVLKPTDKIDLEECSERFPEIAEFKKRYPTFWIHATRIEGHPYAYSVHASGVIVKPPDIELPIATRGGKGKTDERVTVTAWSDTKEQIANFGFLKMDYLVIEGLKRHHSIIHALKEREGIDLNLDLLPVRWDPYGVDPGVMEMFKKCLLLGVWQFDGKGTAPVIKAVQPDDIHDLAAINALIRPAARDGGITDEYAKRKNGQEQITYWHESVEPVLRVTKGLMVYQEQAMEVAVQIGGFTRAEADDLRKAMGKKYREGMPAVHKFLRELGYEEKFLDGARAHIDGETAKDIWSKTLSYGGYGFNAPHAYRYAITAYRDMYLKGISPADFYSQLLSNADTKELPGRLSAAIREGKALGGIEVRPPDINRSELGFTVVDKNTILFGLEGIKGIGPAVCAAIFERRPYQNYVDFDVKSPKSKISDKNKKILVGAGAFDEFGLRQMMTPTEKASNEDAYIGVRLSSVSEVDKYSDVIIETIHTEEEFDAAMDGAFMCVGGEISAVKVTTTKKRGEPMGFVNMMFGLDNYRVTCFPPTWAMYHDQITPGAIVFFEGTKQVDQKYGAGFIARSMISLEELLALRLKKEEDASRSN